ncbi:MAG: glycine zipper domain-containing protein [Pseudomonadota bacterium]
MKTKIALLAAAAALCLTSLAAGAQPRDYRDNQNSYQSDQYRRDSYQSDQYRRDQERDARREERQDRRNYYRQGAYEQNCQRGNQTAGTIFGALAGGALGAGVSNGNGGAAIGGAVLGGLLGNVISKDIDCNDQPYAFGVYTNGLNGQVGRRYDWDRGQNRGYFTPVREYRRRGVVCRDFTTTTYRRGREITRTGTACRDTRDGNWRFD